MAISAEAMTATLLASFEGAQLTRSPYSHWHLASCLPEDMVDAVLALPFPPPALGGLSGKREIHNATRRYFDQEGMRTHPVCAAFNAAFQDRRVTDHIVSRFVTRLSGCYLRVEYAQDTDGFWLEPHTDLGVKVFTMLLYLSRDPSHHALGTDIYDAQKRHVGAAPFAPNSALVFVPSSDTYHGFEKRPIEGVRKSIIINYVTNEWRAREQLAYPSTPIQ